VGRAPVSEISQTGAVIVGVRSTGP
jgi:hypothetical protein